MTWSFVKSFASVVTNERALDIYTSETAVTVTSSQLRIAISRLIFPKFVRISLPPKLINSLQIARTTLSRDRTPCWEYFNFVRLISRRLDNARANSFIKTVTVSLINKLAYLLVTHCEC